MSAANHYRDVVFGGKADGRGFPMYSPIFPWPDRSGFLPTVWGAGARPPSTEYLAVRLRAGRTLVDYRLELGLDIRDFYEGRPKIPLTVH